jgi:CRP/FNR family cyclic AMP-dependent transcriptional regulator
MAETSPRRGFLAPGMVMIAQGGKTGQLCVLRDGTVEVRRDGQHVATIHTPGAVFGEMSVLLDLPQTATVTAVTEVDYFVIDDAIAVLRTHPEWLLQIARLLAQRVNATTARLTSRSDDEAIILPHEVFRSWGDPAV